jgi:hypothetical protein
MWHDAASAGAPRSVRTLCDRSAPVQQCDARCRDSIQANEGERDGRPEASTSSGTVMVPHTHRLFDLSDDLLVSVLARCAPSVPDLVAFSAVSRRARRVAHDPVLWRHVVVPAIDSSPHATVIRDEDEDDVDSDEGGAAGPFGNRKRRLKRGKQVPRKRPRPSGSSSAAEACSAAVAIDRISRWARQLESLDVSALAPTRSGFRTGHLDSIDTLAERCGRTLRMFSCPPTDSLSPRAIASFVGKCPGLRALALCNVERMTLAGLGSALAAHSSIVRIALVDCQQLKGQGKAVWQAISCVADRLESLDVTGTHLSSLPLREMAQHCVELEELICDRCPNLQFQQSFPSRSQTAWFPKLQWARFDFSNGSFAPFLRGLFVRRSPLRALSLNAHLPNMEIQLFQYPLSAQLPALQHLAVAGQNVTDRWFSDVVLDRLGGTLQTLDVSKSARLSGSFLCDAHRLHALEQLDISATRFTEQALRTLVAVAPNLKLLKADGCRSISNRELRRDALTYLRRPK